METVILAKQLQFAWPDQGNTLDISALTVTKGQRIFLHGPSGSGKSTLLGLLAGVNTASSGELTILNTDLAALSASQRDSFRADHIGYIFQQFNLLPYLSVIENVLLPLRFSHKRNTRVNAMNSTAVAEATRLLLALQLPNELLAKSVTELSIGQQQRVAAARALIGSPDIIIADEPTSALDHNAREHFLKLLFSECEKANTTLVFVSHDETLVPLFENQLSLLEINNVTVKVDSLGDVIC